MDLTAHQLFIKHRCLGAHVVDALSPGPNSSELGKAALPELRKGALTLLSSLATSNAHQAAHCQELLAGVVSAQDLALLLGSDHAKATCLEAAVGLVAEAELQQPRDEGAWPGSAVDCLAEALLARAGVSEHSHRHRRHPKNVLLESGGAIVWTERVVPSPDHAPLFRAEAALWSYRADSGPACHGTKRGAETAAAAAVLAAVGAEEKFRAETRGANM
jgi:hypothetical protein